MKQQSLYPEPTMVAPAPPRAGFVLDGLNPDQATAVTHPGGPLLVIAGAGSGKTRTLVYRVAWLIDQGVDPGAILLLTFTRRAAAEMLSRAAALVDDSCHRVWGGTFHAVGNLLLRRYGSVLGYPANFTILDRADSEGIINLLRSALKGVKGERRFPSKRVLADIYSRACNCNRTLEEQVREAHPHLLEYMEEIEEIARQYQRFKLDHGLMDYDDLLVNWKRLLEEDDEARSAIAGRFGHILVDEYQDTNHLQAGIVRLLAADHRNVMAVGDDSQSIYSFRGADFRNIMEFPALFPDATVVRLEENYRSTNAILAVANAVIRHASQKYEKHLFTRRDGGAKPVFQRAGDEGAQARWVADQIEARLAEGVPPQEIAVLFRSGFHSYKLELELQARGLPFEKRGGLKLTEAAHVKDILSFLRLLCNADDRLSWNRVLLQLPGIGAKGAATISTWLAGQDDPIAAMGRYPGKGKWRPLYDALAEAMATAAAAATPGQALERIRAYYQPLFEQLYPDDYPRRAKDLEQLAALVSGYDNLQAFIDDTALEPPEAAASSETTGRLVLSTVHSAKGLEWDTVFIIHLAQSRFPAGQAMFDEQLEEERRLFYVAVTRAKERLFLVYPRRCAGADRQFTDLMVSCFIEEIDPGLLAAAGGFRAAVPSPVGAPSRARQRPRPAVPRLAAGMTVSHPFFGRGTVERTVGSRTVEVFFPRHGRKTLHLDYARLEVVE